MNILQYESKIWSTADLLRGSGIKESEWPSFMMPFFALAMIESRLIRMFDELKTEFGDEVLEEADQEELVGFIGDKGQGYNTFLFEKGQSLASICKNDKSFDIDFEAYLNGFDGETKDLLGVDAAEGEKFLDIKGVISKLKAKKILFSYAKLWSEIDLKPFNNSEITTLEEHIKRKWADISAETAGEQYTPDDIIALIAEIITSKVEESDKLLKLYDCTAGGGNMIFGVEDRINKKLSRLTQTFGQDWNDALYALAKIESRFRTDSFIEHGNTLVDDKFYNEEFDVVVANPPYGVSWKGYEKDIQNDKTGRFEFLPSTPDGQLLFMQHLISKLNSTGVGVVVHSASSLSGGAGSAESNIRKSMLDRDIVEAVIQLPTDEFFNTDIYTYLWVLNKDKEPSRKNKIILIDASEKFNLLKKSKGSKRKEIDKGWRLDITATLNSFVDNDYARVFDKEFFYFNKQLFMLTNIDVNGKSYENQLQQETSTRLNPVKITQGEIEITELIITEYDKERFPSLLVYHSEVIKPLVAKLDYNEQPLTIITSNASYYYDNSQSTLIREVNGEKVTLGCGKIIVKSVYKKPTKKLSAKIVISVDLMPSYQKDYEIIGFNRDASQNQLVINAYMDKYISKPFRYLDSLVGVEINFNKVFKQPSRMSQVSEVAPCVEAISQELDQYVKLQKSLVQKTLICGLDENVEMVDSGVDWIGKMPKHWSVKRINDIVKQNKTKNSDLKEKNLLSLSYGRIIRKDFNSNYGLLPASFETYQVVKAGTIILRLTDLQNDQRSLRVGLCKEKGIITSAYLGLIFDQSIDPRFAYYLLHLYDLCKIFYWFGGGLRSTMRYNDIKVIPFLIPPIKEQREIACFLDERYSEIDKIINILNKKIEDLKNLRRTLVSDALTGKMKNSNKRFDL